MVTRRTWLVVLAGALAIPAWSGAASGPPIAAFTALGPYDRPDVVLADANGNVVANLTPGLATDGWADWSLDGSRLIFTSQRDSNVESHLYVMNADGTGQRRLTFAPGTLNADADWSPNGELIAWRQIRGNTDEIWVMNADGSGQRALTSDAGRKSEPRFSPDGQTILYARQGGGSAVFVVTPAGTGAPTQLTPADEHATAPVWSPDGSRIAYIGGLRVRSMLPDGSGRRELSKVDALSGLAWSPDGTRVAFAGRREFWRLTTRFGPPTVNDVYVVRADGSATRRLTGPLHDDFAPAPSSSAPSWTPDGSRLLFETFRNDAARTWVMDADGRCERQFTREPWRLLRPSWRPGDTAALAPLRCSDPGLSVNAERTVTALGQPVTLRVSVWNDGTDTATSVRIRVQTTFGTAWIDPVCTAPAKELVCPIGTLAPGELRTYTAFVASPTAAAGSVTTSVGADDVDANTWNDAVLTYAAVWPCTLVGSEGNDALVGTPRRDAICGRTGADRIDALAGNDSVDAGNGNDTLEGGPGRDKLVGRGGRDVILARDGARDTVECGHEHDVVLADRLDAVAPDCERVLRR